MNLCRPLVGLAASLMSFTACMGSDPDPAGQGGTPSTAGTSTSGASNVAGTSAGGSTGAVGTGGNATSGSASGGNGVGGLSNIGGMGGAPSGGSSSGGTPPSGGSGGGSAGAGGGSPGKEGPCDIYAKGSTPCVAAYSTIRRLLSTYSGPLYQVRTGSSAMNTGSGGMLVNIGQTTDGFADAKAQDTACANTTCTVAKLYDQSGKGNDITVGKKGLTNGGMYAGTDDFETVADKGPLTVAGRDVYSLFMEARQGYRQTMAGNGMAIGDQPQGIYELADGTRVGGACCWDFGNVTPDPTKYAEMNTLFFGQAYWGRGAGNGPWFGADFEAGVWMGGSKPGDPGWGGLDDAKNAPANMNNPSLKVKFAIGFLKTTNGPERYALRMADLSTATMLTTAYAGNYPSTKKLGAKGAVVLGVGGDNSNNSFGTFYEGAITQGYPMDATEDAVFQNVKAIGYGK